MSKQNESLYWCSFFFTFTPQNVPCSALPCQNGATCQEDCSGNYKCVCSAGYTGANCEESMVREGNVSSGIVKY